MRVFCISLVIYLTLNSSVFAAPKVEKVGEGEAGLRVHTNAVVRQIPFASQMISRAQELNAAVELLRSGYPQYDRWMKEKPGPYTFEAYKEEATFTTDLELAETHLLSIQSQVQAQFNKLQREVPADLSPADKIKWLKEQGYKNLLSSMEISNESVRGIFVGLALLLQGAEKGEFFKLGDPLAQLRFLEDKKITDEMLKESAFRPEQVGLTKENVSVERVFSVIRNRLSRSTQMMTWLSFLKATSKLKAADFSNSGRFLSASDSFSKLLNASDFDFVYKAHSDFLSDVNLRLLQSGQQNEAWVQNQVRAFQADIPRGNFKATMRTSTNRKLVARVYEVLPHLGIYRGCIGGDCSTSLSAFFPLSPWEHVFYIANEKGEFVGYATVTRLKVNGVDSIYLKDLNGANLSPEIAEIALQAIAKSASLYGAKKFLIANATFTNGNNGNYGVRVLLNEYMRIGEVQNLEFYDSGLRQYLKNQLSLASYDLATTHPNGVLLKANQLKRIPFKFRSIEGTIPDIHPTLLTAEAIRAPARVILEGQSIEEAARVLSKAELAKLVDTINNSESKSVNEHMTSSKQTFAAYGLPYDQAFRAKHHELLARGYLRAPDILSETSKSWSKFGISIFVNFLKEGKHVEDTVTFFKAWSNKIIGNEDFEKTLAEIGKRLNPQDVFALYSFAENGSKTAKAILQDPGHRLKIEAALELLVDFDNGLKIKGKDPRKGEKVGLAGLRYFLDNPETASFGEMKQKFGSILKSFKIGFSDLQNAKVRNEMEIALLRSSNAFRSNIVEWYSRIQDKVKGNQISGLQFLNWLSDFDSEGKSVQKTVQLRIDELKKAKTDAAAMELHALEAMGFSSAGKALLSPEILDVNSKVVRAVLKKTFGSGDYAPLSKEAFAIFEFVEEFERKNKLDTITIGNLRREVGWIGKSASETFDHWAEALTIAGVRWEDLISSPLIARLSAKGWLKLPDAFNSNFDEITDMSFKFFFYLIRSGKDEKVVWTTFFNNSMYLKQLSGFKSFAESLRKSFLEEKCESCGRGLAQMMSGGLLEKDYISGKDATLRLLTSSFSDARIYGFVQAIQSRNQDLLSEQIISTVARDLSELVVDGTNFGPRILKESALAALAQAPGNSPKLRAVLLSWMEYEPINIYALRVVKIYLASGGDAKKAKRALTNHFNRVEISNRPSSEEASILRTLEEKISEAKGQALAGTCRVLF